MLREFCVTEGVVGMKDLIVVGHHFSTDHSDVVDALRPGFDVVIFDFLHLGRTIDSLSGRNIACVVMRLEYFEFLAAVTALLAPTGTSVAHCVAWNDVAPTWSSSDLWQIGLCDVLDTSLTADSTVSRIGDVCASCDRHPPSLLIDRPDLLSDADDANALTGLDREITHLVVRGMSDREISEVVNFSTQTVRNRISRILRDNGFSNRTELATAQLRHSFRHYLETSTGSESTTPPRME